jgi:hypothetical protein
MDAVPAHGLEDRPGPETRPVRRLFLPGDGPRDVSAAQQPPAVQPVARTVAAFVTMCLLYKGATTSMPAVCPEGGRSVDPSAGRSALLR